MPDASQPSEHTGEVDVRVPERPHRPWWKQAMSIGVTLLVLVAVFGFVLPGLTDYGSILEYIGEISVGEWVLLVSISIVFVMAYPFVLVQALVSLRLREAFVNHMAGTAITNSVPSGGAIALPVNYTMYMSWGFTPASISAGMLSAGVWDWLLRISLPVLAVLGIALTGEALGWMWLVSIGGILAVVVMVLVLSKILGREKDARRFAQWIDRMGTLVFRITRRDKPDLESAVMQFRTDLNSIVQSRALRLTIATINNHLAMAALFAVSVYSVGIETDQISIPWMVLAFALGRFLVMIPVSPGGLGLVDLGWIGLLTLGWQTANPGVPVDRDLIAAGVLLFRALTLLPPILIGMASWLFWRADKSWRQDWQTVRRGETPA
ncbi:MAG: YbhN family protein [Acidimicrobiia bacterium]